jgi:hypothetical protein
MQEETQELRRRIGDLLNHEINLGGEIQLSNKNIWGVLHSMDDRVWVCLLEAVIEESKTEPGLKSAAETAYRLLDNINSTGGVYIPWTLTATPKQEKLEHRPQEHRFKGRVWYFIQQLREYRCVELGIDFPNKAISKGKLNEIRLSN